MIFTISTGIYITVEQNKLLSDFLHSATADVCVHKSSITYTMDSYYSEKLKELLDGFATDLGLPMPPKANGEQIHYLLEDGEFVWKVDENWIQDQVRSGWKLELVKNEEIIELTVRIER